MLEQLKKVQPDLVTEQKNAEDQEISSLDQEIGPDRARALQSQVGNQSLVTLLRNNGRNDGPGLEIEVEEAEEEGEAEQEQEADQELDRPESTFGASLAAGVAPQSYDNADWDFQYGGDGDPEDAPPPPPKRRAFRRSGGSGGATRDPKVKGAEQEDEEELLGDLPPLAHPDDPQGDERFDALWGWLQQPEAMASADLQPEDLVDCPPELARCMLLGGFFQRSGRDPLSRALGSLAGPLPGGPGLASQVSRAAALATVAGLVEAERTGLHAANKAATLALEDDAYQHGLTAARICVRQSRLAAHLIFEHATAHERHQLPAALANHPPGRHAAGLVEAAITAVMAAEAIPRAPRFAREFEEDQTSNAATAALDRLLRELTGAEEPEAQPLLDHTELEPLIHGIEDLVHAAGRVQIEVAAAAIAAEHATSTRIHTRVWGLLRAADRDLRQIAREMLHIGEELEARVGEPVGDAMPLIERSEHQLEDLVARVERLRESAVAALSRVTLSAEASP